MRQVPENASVACRVGMLSREFTAAAGRLLKPHGVTPLQANLFWELIHGTTSPGKMAEDMGIETSGVSRALHTMEKKGWIRREIDPDNRTRIRVALTEEGGEVADRIDPHAYVIQGAIVEALGEDGVAQLEATLQKISGALTHVQAPNVAVETP